MWKDAVSIAQRARKKMYCSKMGWEARRFDGLSVPVDGAVAFVGLDGNGGGGVNGRAGDDGVAFSMRAHVR